MQLECMLNASVPSRCDHDTADCSFTPQCSFTLQQIVLSGHETLPMLSGHGQLLVFHFVIRWHVHDECSSPVSLCPLDLLLLGVDHCIEEWRHNRLNFLRIGQLGEILDRIAKQRVPQHDDGHSFKVDKRVWENLAIIVYMSV